MSDFDPFNDPAVQRLANEPVQLMRRQAAALERLVALMERLHQRLDALEARQPPPSAPG